MGGRRALACRSACLPLDPCGLPQCLHVRQVLRASDRRLVLDESRTPDDGNTVPLQIEGTSISRGFVERDALHLN